MTTLTSPSKLAPPVEVSRRPTPVQRVKQVWQYRELLANLTRKELKVKYKNSALGFVWSLLNPILYLAVFYIVFQVFLPGGLPYFAIFLLAGLLPWTFFSTALAGATSSITGNGALVTKVWFPREILPLAAIGAAMVHFLLQSVVLVAALVAFRYTPAPEYLPVLIPAFLALVLFLGALSLALAALNVYARDMQHLLELALLAWFWMTPIVYQYERVAERLGRWGSLYLLNPMTAIVITFQRAIYNRTSVDGGKTKVLPDASPWWYLRNVGVVVAVSLVLLLVALTIFGRLEDNFAEEI